MIKVTIWKDDGNGRSKTLIHNTLSEEDVIEAISMLLFTQGVIDFNNKYEIEIDSFVR